MLTLPSNYAGLFCFVAGCGCSARLYYSAVDRRGDFAVPRVALYAARCYAAQLHGIFPEAEISDVTRKTEARSEVEK